MNNIYWQQQGSDKNKTPTKNPAFNHGMALALDFTIYVLSDHNILLHNRDPLSTDPNRSSEGGSLLVSTRLHEVAELQYFLRKFAEELSIAEPVGQTFRFCWQLQSQLCNVASI